MHTLAPCAVKNPAPVPLAITREKPYIASMGSTTQGSCAKALALTVRSLYGDLLDLPLFAPATLDQHAKTSPSEALAAYEQKIRHCQNCMLHIGRSQLVFGRGNPQAKVAFVGDFPSDGDDASGQPFSDAAGELLHKMIVAMKLKPEEVYLTNVLKCRPPASQKPQTEFFLHCERHLQQQFQWLHAPLVVALGDFSAKALASAEAPLAVLRKQTFSWNDRSVFCTHHPRDLLRDPAKKKEAWEDLQLVMLALAKL